MSNGVKLFSALHFRRDIWDHEFSRHIGHEDTLLRLDTQPPHFKGRTDVYCDAQDDVTCRSRSRSRIGMSGALFPTTTYVVDCSVEKISQRCHKHRTARLQDQVVRSLAPGPAIRSFGPGLGV